MSIAPRLLPSELHYIIPLADQHGTKARIWEWDPELGRHTGHVERLSSDEIAALSDLYREISARDHGRLINQWHEQHQLTPGFIAATTWPVYGLLILFQELGERGVVPFDDGEIRPHP